MRLQAVLLGAAVAAACASPAQPPAPAAAGSDPRSDGDHNVRLVGYHDLQGRQSLVVTTKSDRVYHFHESTLHALKELIQAAGLKHPSGLTADHIVRRNSEQAVKLLANLLPFAKPGELLRGEPTQQVFRIYWPMASAASFGVAHPAAA